MDIKHTKHKLGLLPLAALLTLIACGLAGCGGDKGAKALNNAAVGFVEPVGQTAAFEAATSVISSGLPGGDVSTDADATLPQEDSPIRHTRLMAMLAPYDTVRAHNPYEAHYDSMPPGGIKMKINSLGGPLGRVFNDSNKFHIEVAEANGIRPLHDLSLVWQEAGKLQRVRTCEAYYVDNLTHSLPYLVPKAHRLLTDIGEAFRDSLRSRGGGYYRIKVTSVLRTPSLVRKLRRRNRNAVDTSAHLYATTFDISYLKFICDTPSIPRTQEDLKNLLGEVIEDMRRNERCYVKYERKQACYHITAR